MMPNLKPSQNVAVPASLNPVSRAAGTSLTIWVDASQYEFLLGILSIGPMGAGGTITAKLQQAQDNAGTNAKDIAGTTTAAFAQGVNDNQQALINLKCDQLDINNGFTFVALSVTAAVAASLVSGHILGLNERNGPADQTNPASVVAIVN
ncbi:hypothetical protein SAMN05519104_6675 [Rhizobiales bacterium GAS188]|nr:hypothetical protein SAMN05519104_6675 [Rhizobiales bacterium GAS188]